MTMRYIPARARQVKVSISQEKKIRQTFDSRLLPRTFIIHIYVLRVFVSSKSRDFHDEAYKSTLGLLSAAVKSRRLSNFVSYMMATLPVGKVLSSDDKRSLFPQFLTIKMAISEIRRHKPLGWMNLQVSPPLSLAQSSLHPNYPTLYLYCYLVSIIKYLDFWRVLIALQ